MDELRPWVPHSCCALCNKGGKAQLSTSLGDHQPTSQAPNSYCGGRCPRSLAFGDRGWRPRIHCAATPRSIRIIGVCPAACVPLSTCGVITTTSVEEFLSLLFSDTLFNPGI